MSISCRVYQRVKKQEKINQTSRNRGILSSKTLTALWRWPFPDIRAMFAFQLSTLILHHMFSKELSESNFCLSHHFVFLYLKNASRHNVPKSKLGKQGSNLINTTNYITIRYEEPISFFNSDHLGIGRCKWRSYTKYHFIKLFFSPLENQESGLHMCVKAFHSKDLNRWI